MSTIKCWNCGSKTPEENQFCQHCLENLGEPSHFQFIQTAPWEINPIEKERYAGGGYKTQQAIYDQVMEDKKKWTADGKWGRWEKDRKERLQERRKYFRKHKDKKDDFTGV